MWVWGLSYAAVLSLIGYGMMGADKQRSRAGQWRIPERTLLLLAVLGGSPGVWLGMQQFRHKTKHGKFRYGIPLIIMGQVALIYWVMTRFA